MTKLNVDTKRKLREYLEGQQRIMAAVVGIRGDFKGLYEFVFGYAKDHGQKGLGMEVSVASLCSWES